MKQKKSPALIIAVLNIHVGVVNFEFQSSFFFLVFIAIICAILDFFFFLGLGGCSSINGMLYMRGQAEDYDYWRDSGNKGWLVILSAEAGWGGRGRGGLGGGLGGIGYFMINLHKLDLTN